MGKWKSVQGLASLILLASVLILIGMTNDGFIQMGLFFVLVIILICLGITRHTQKILEQQSKVMIDQKCIEAFNNYRHDSLNDLQVLFGYIKLKKYDNLERFMDKIKQKLEQESLITKINIPSTVLYLMSVRAKEHIFELYVDVEQGLQLSELPMSLEVIGEIIEGMVCLFQNTSQCSHEEVNQLDIYIHSSTNAIVLTFDYSGLFLVNDFNHSFEQQKNSYKHLNEIKISSNIKEMNAWIEYTVLHS